MRPYSKTLIQGLNEGVCVIFDESGGLPVECDAVTVGGGGGCRRRTHIRHVPPQLFNLQLQSLVFTL